MYLLLCVYSISQGCLLPLKFIFEQIINPAYIHQTQIYKYSIIGFFLFFFFVYPKIRSNDFFLLNLYWGREYYVDIQVNINTDREGENTSKLCDELAAVISCVSSSFSSLASLCKISGLCWTLLMPKLNIQWGKKNIKMWTSIIIIWERQRRFQRRISISQQEEKKKKNTDVCCAMRFCAVIRYEHQGKKLVFFSSLNVQIN